ncbi:hypothetical protein E2C01_029770 [Portunus trituberculatus]|uniref:Uncharacterized protein n=1 Tax=Portunus trituberculatus TaxID=210409 RepID=A0A5B7ET46_PORTR|nr:hypothetical protein [Portunus trituberculatus]
MEVLGTDSRIRRDRDRYNVGKRKEERRARTNQRVESAGTEEGVGNWLKSLRSPRRDGRLPAPAAAAALCSPRHSHIFTIRGTRHGTSTPGTNNLGTVTPALPPHQERSDHLYRPVPPITAGGIVCTAPVASL